MSDLVIAWIRTSVPSIVGLVIGAAATAGIEIDSAALEIVISGAFISAWYVLARWLESNVPWLSWINGVAKQPTY